MVSVDGADSTGGVGDFAGNGFDAAGKKRKMSSKHEPEPIKKKPTLQVGPYSTFDDVDWNDENSVEQYISNNFPILTGANEELVPLRAPPTTAPSYASPVHDPMFAPPTTSPSPIFLAPRTPPARTPSPAPPRTPPARTPSPAPSSLSYTLPPTNHQTFEENDITFDHPSFHSTPLHSPAPSSLGYTLPPTNYQSPERQIDDEVENLLDSILSTTYEDQEDGQRLLNGQGSQQLFDELFGRDAEDDLHRDGEEGGQDRDVGRDGGQDRDVGMGGGQDRDVDRDGEQWDRVHEEGYEDLFMKQNEDSNRKHIPDHEMLRMLIKNQTYLRREDRIPPSKFSPFMNEFSSHMLTLQRSTMAAIQGNIKSHQEISTGLMMCLFSKYTGLEFLDSTERKKKNWLSIAIKNYTERVIGKNLK